MEGSLQIDLCYFVLFNVNITKKNVLSDQPYYVWCPQSGQTHIKNLAANTTRF